MPRLDQLLGIIRTPFLALTPVCVLLGMGSAYWVNGAIPVGYVVLVFCGALMAHISVNAFNEYTDFNSGLDLHTERTPFSGGSGVLPAAPELVPLAWWIAVGSLTITAVLGIWLVILCGIALLPLGLLGMAIIVSYSTWIQRHPLLCLIAPGLGFGPLMVMGTHYVILGNYDATAISASLIPFFLVSSLLLVNQFPDIEADSQVGRRHYPILIGPHASSFLYGSFLLASYLVLVGSVIMNFLPIASLLGLITLPVAVKAFAGLQRLTDSPEASELIPIMAMSALLSLSTPLLVLAGLVLPK